MIRKIKNNEKPIAHKIRNVFQASYAVEAKILSVIDFPPLKRTLSKIVNSDSDFFAYYQSNDIIGVIEVKNSQELTHIQSLAIYPEHFRKGIGKKLVQFILDRYTTMTFTVETGLGNDPAIKLYESFDFKREKQWHTNHGVQKVRFKKIM